MKNKHCSEAEYFAYCLVMPEKMVLEWWDKVSVVPDIDRIKYMQEIFAVSREHMLFRLRDLNLI